MMTSVLTRIATARALVIVGFAVGIYTSLFSTFDHIGSEAYITSTGSTHTWHHLLREAFGDIAAMIGILIILFADSRFRNPVTWWLMFIMMVGYYAPYWIGIPFMTELGPPGGLFSRADWYHIVQAALPLLGAFLVRKHFFPGVSGNAAAHSSMA